MEIVAIDQIRAILVVGSILITRHLSSERTLSRWQNIMEVIINAVMGEISEISREHVRRYFPFIGSLFLFIALSNMLTFIPGYVAPTSSLTTTAALAVAVFFAVPIYGIASQGVLEYLKEYFRPNFLFFPFHVMGEFSRTLALAVRLFGNLMSHEKVVGILLAVTPLFFPVVMQVLGLLIGLIQAYIFAILTMVYIASATQTHEEAHKKHN